MMNVTPKTFDRARMYVLWVLATLFRRGGGRDPHAPYPGVRQPKRRGPRDRFSAVAVNEPDEEHDVSAVGVLRR